MALVVFGVLVKIPYLRAGGTSVSGLARSAIVTL